MSYKLKKDKIKLVGKIIFILLFFRLLFWLKSSTTLLILVSTIIYKLIRKTRKAFAYPEIHYVLARRLSFIYKPYPEVITDAPRRVKAGEPIPILCIIKDADKFPVHLLDITVRVRGDGFDLEEWVQYPDDKIMKLISSLNPGRSITPKKGLIDRKYWYTVGYIQIPEDYVGRLEISPKINLTLEKRSFFRHNKVWKQHTIFTDNLPMLSHAPLQVYVSKNDLPTFDGWYYGDAHCHSDRTDNQTEFGAPPIVIRSMGKAIGLKWVVITDHSFDLDTPVNQFYGIDSKRIRWKSLDAEIELTNSLFDDLLLMRGEEISCGNANEENIHLLAYGISEFIPGRGDGCKDRDNLYDFTNPPDIALVDALKKIKENGGFAFAAHPDANSHRLAKFFINRGIWQDEDCKPEECSGLQIWNSCGSDDSFEKSYERWINLLLDGYKKQIIAGSDAHGDFNTPETTLSGMLGGMPVAVSAGLCLTRLRLKSGLEPALPSKYIVMAGVRDTDPLEQELIDRSRIEMITVNDIRTLSENIQNQMNRLSQLTDLIYVHVDMDVLDPEEVSGHSLTVANGPTSVELAAALKMMFQYEKTAAFGIASYPWDKDEDGKSLFAAYNLIEGVLTGIKTR